jgi:hypothetical protein
MEPTSLADLAQTVAGLGALGIVIAALNVVALRGVRPDEVPSWVQARIRWWGLHNPAFFVASAAITAAGLATLAVTAL